MAMTKEELLKHLLVLKIQEDVSNVTLRNATDAFHDLALELHPDKAGKQSTAAFQELLHSYTLIRKHFKAKNDIADDNMFESDEEGRFFYDNFDKFHFPFENKGSFTVLIEDHLANTWQDCLEKLLGSPKVVINPWGTECDRNWKTKHEGIAITIHIYNNPKNGNGSKLMIQGSVQSLICSFVFKELPKIYRIVCENKPKTIQESRKAKRELKKPSVNCELCNFKSSLIQMKLHIKNVHANKTKRASKRSPAFTPIAKPPKRVKSNKAINCQGLIDDSMFLVPDGPHDDTMETLQEQEAVPMEVQGGNPNIDVNVTGLLSCNHCEFDCELETDLQEHMLKGIHSHRTERDEAFDCEECNFLFGSEQLLQNHINAAHGQKNNEEVIANENTTDCEVEDKETSFLCGQCDLCFDSLEECLGHVDAHMFKCFKCSFENEDKTVVDNHENDAHPILVELSSNSDEVDDSRNEATWGANIEDAPKQSTTTKTTECVICPFCKLQSKDLDMLKKHIESIHTTGDIKRNTEDDIIAKDSEPCTKCQYCSVTGNQAEMRRHLEIIHFVCTQCTSSFMDSTTLKNHIEAKHTEIEPFPCEICGLVVANFFLLQEHVQTHNKQSRMPCQHCEFSAKDTQSLKSHMIECHEEVVILHTMAQQVDNLTDNFESFETFKTEVANMFKSLFDHQNIVQQEMFLIRNHLTTQARPATDDAQHIPRTSQPTRNPDSVGPPPSRSPPRRSSSPLPRTAPSRQTSGAAPNIPSSSTREQKQILYIGDSISANANFNALEAATEAEFVRVKAYSAVHDTVSNDAKRAAKFPASNFKDVIPNELKKKKYECLVVQAGSVDITNLNTKDDPAKHIDYFREETIKSATSLFNSATNALSVQPTLKKVVLMKQTPRYDPSSEDPMALKPALALLFNNTLTGLWTESPNRERLFIGNHNIECSGAIREARYRETKSGKYDGYHLFGSSGTKAFTLSVLNILKKAEVTSSEYNFHQSCPQSKRQHRGSKSHARQNHGGHQNVFTVPTNNRFSSFQSNQGNL